MVRMWSALLVSLWLSACGGVPVSSDWDPSYAFAGVSSYAWLPAPTQDSYTAPAFHNDLLDSRIRAAVNAQLLARGMRQVDDASGADLLVTYHYGIADKIDINSFHSHFGYYPCFHCYGFFHDPFYEHELWVSEYQQGTLYIDMIDPKSRKLVWRGVSERRLPHLENPEERRLYISETVAAIMEHFPPHAQP